MITETVLNSLKVKPVEAGVGHWDATNNKAYSISPHTPYFNMFLCARKKSGKSSCINLITQKCINKNTNIWVFCSTYEIDPTWKEIIKTLESKGNVVNCFDSIYEGKTNLLNEIINEINKPEEEEEVPKVKERKLIQLTLDDVEEEQKKKYKPKKQACEHLIIFDDMPAAMLRSPSVARLLKIHRHSKTSVIISSQYPWDLQPQSLMQIDLFLAFKGLAEERLEKIHKLLDLSIDFEKFKEIYHHCTEEQYSFMYCSIRDEQFRRKFNYKINY